jgi:hypothetical protein
MPKTSCICICIGLPSTQPVTKREESIAKPRARARASHHLRKAKRRPEKTTLLPKNAIFSIIRSKYKQSFISQMHEFFIKAPTILSIYLYISNIHHYVNK